MIHRNSILLVICFSPQLLLAQFERTAGKIVNDNYPGGLFETVNNPGAKTTEGSIYLYDQWKTGKISLYMGRVFEDLPVKINLHDHYLLIKLPEGENRALRFDKVKRFDLDDPETGSIESFVNCSEFIFSHVTLDGFYRLLYDDSVRLLAYYELYLQKGNYSQMHDAGNPNDTYYIKKDIYIASHEALSPFNNKRDIRVFAGSRWDAVNSFMKKNNIRDHSDDDLIKIARYYNSLLK